MKCKKIRREKLYAWHWKNITFDSSGLFRSPHPFQVPPNLLVKYGVSVSRIVQEPGQFVVAFSKAYTSNVCTGYSIAESVYFAPRDYLAFCQTEFDSIRESKEPMMFPLAKLMLCLASDPHAGRKKVLTRVLQHLEKIRDYEYIKRTMISDLGVKQSERIILKSKKQDQDDEYECEVCSENLYVSYVSGGRRRQRNRSGGWVSSN